MSHSHNRDMLDGRVYVYTHTLLSGIISYLIPSKNKSYEETFYS